MKETIKNLTKAFVGESQARNRYTFYSEIAKDEGFEQIAEIFLITADNEREHASWFFKLINDFKKKTKEDLNEIEIETSVPTILGKTLDNLRAAIAGENHEHTMLYPGFADAAKKEGYKDIAKRIRSIAIAEKHHEERYKKILKEVEAKTVFKKPKEIWWFCRECGYMHFGREPPVTCPSCGHDRGFYQVRCEEY